jgi:adenylate cyclase
VHFGAKPDLADPLLSLWPHLGKSLLLVASGALAGLVGLQIRMRAGAAFQSLEERNRVVDLFGRHASPEVVDRLLQQHGDLPNEVRHVCVMFLDIRGFTTYCEGRPPEQVVSYLNNLFDFMIDTVNEHRGIVNKFLGDGFMAVFGAPLSDGNDSRNAVAAALRIVERVQTVSPGTRIGIGLHAGPAVTGNVGSSRRKEYTIIGDVVNVASRVEGLNKEFASQLLITRPVLDALDQGAVKATERGPVAVKGRDAPVQVFQLV